MRFINSYPRVLVLFLINILLIELAHSQTMDYSMQYNRSSAPSGSTGLHNAAASISPSLYTGELQLSLPIYTLQSTDLKVPISIAYTASNGVRPSDPNTCVGMDWDLMAGGSIARTVRGLPDEVPYGYIGTHDEASVVSGDFSTPNGTTTQDFNNTFNIAAGNPVVDGEPDLFVITTPYFNAHFTLDLNGNPVFTDNTGLQVIHHLFNNSPSADSYGITVIDPGGTQYIFGTQPASRELTTTIFFGTSLQYVSTWYLEKIITLNSKDVINFTYQTFGDETVRNYQLNKSYTSTFASSPWPPPPTTDPSSISNVTVLNVLVSTTYYNVPKFVSAITTSLGEADFTYTGNTNSYLNNSNPPKLTAITIKQFNPITNGNTTVLQTYNLAYTDIETGLSGQTPPYADTAVWADYYRRTLDSITVTGNTTATSTPVTLYNLKYYQSLPYTNRYLPQNCDFWGYQNSNVWLTDADNEDENFFIYPDSYRLPASFVPAGSSQSVPMAAIFGLQELDQLGGGSTVFNYQQNDYYNGSANVAAGGIRISSIVRQLPTGESLTTSYNYYNSSGQSTGQIWSDLYRHVRMYFTPTCCSVSTLAMSSSPYGIADDMGVIVGYSSVTVTDPNNGYTVSNFTNFSDYPDIIPTQSFFSFLNVSSTYQASVSEQLSSFSYKRGLLVSSTAYNANGNIVSKDQNTYGSLDTQPLTGAVGMQDMTWYITQPVYWGVNIYHSNIEHWRLLQTTHNDYDQVTPSVYHQAITTYTYTPDERQVRSVSTTDSKGQNYTTTYYYSGDINYSQVTIPDITTSEQTALTAMASTAVNATGILVHQAVSRNGTVHQKHYSWSAISLGITTNYYLTSDASYTGTTLESQNSYAYDPSTSQMISAETVGDMSVSTMYAYNNSYPVGTIKNSSSSATYSVQQTTQSGSIQSVPGSITFTTGYAGTITLREMAANGTGVNFNLSGGGIDVNSSMCYGTGCGVYASSYTVSNAPAGTYTLSVTAGSGSGATITCTYPVISTSHTSTAEYFYEGFEQNTAATAGSAHTGTMYYNTSYTVPYTPPNSRTYLIQWWNLSGGQWVFNQQPYTTNMTLAGPVDDVRVFPSDALMTTYTYSPQLGKTSETDPSGRSIIYEYDGLGRLQDIRDQNGNLIKQYNYQYQVGLSN